MSQGWGAEVLIDRERFKAGKVLVAQMDAIQDTADINVFVLSPDYLKSANCVHEMKRAVACDPGFVRGALSPSSACHVLFPLTSPVLALYM